MHASEKHLYGKHLLNVNVLLFNFTPICQKLIYHILIYYVSTIKKGKSRIQSVPTNRKEL